MNRRLNQPTFLSYLLLLALIVGGMLYGLGLSGQSRGKPNFVTNLITSGPMVFICPGLIALVFLLLLVQVLAARVAGIRVAAQPRPADTELAQVLARGIGFAPSDLEANRQGRLSAAQLDNYRYFGAPRRSELPRAAASCSRLIAFFAMGFFISVLVVMVGGTAVIPDVNRNSLFLPVILGGGLAGALVITAILESLRLLLRGAFRGRAPKPTRTLGPDYPVQVAEGRVRLTSGVRGNRISSSFKMLVIISGKRFSVSESAFGAFWSGARYRVYYIQHGRNLRLLSAEYLGS